MQFRILLYPFSLIYGLITNLRNKLFDWQLLSSRSYPLPIISVGNITVGGTGKTPLTEYLIRLLINERHIALLSRGYKRQTKGALLADENATAATIGDEPFQIRQKFPDIDVSVAEKRVEGMDLIMRQTLANLVLMDDAYQHRYVKPDLSILVIDYHRPLWKDFVFPAGNLRETRRGQKRAHLIVVNKCPADMTAEDQQYWLKKLRALPHQQVFFSTIEYGSLHTLEDYAIKEDVPKKIMALAGIAKPAPFFNYLKEKFEVVEQVHYPDHHHFTDKDIHDIQQQFDESGAELLITTEKDAVRLQNFPKQLQSTTGYIPIQLKILFNQSTQFEKTIHLYVREN